MRWLAERTLRGVFTLKKFVGFDADEKQTEMLMTFELMHAAAVGIQPPE